MNDIYFCSMFVIDVRRSASPVDGIKDLWIRYVLLLERNNLISKRVFKNI